MPLPIREFIWVYSFIFSIFKVRMIGWFLFKVNCEDHHVSCGFELFKMLLYSSDPHLFITYVFSRAASSLKFDWRKFQTQLDKKYESSANLYP